MSDIPILPDNYSPVEGGGLQRTSVHCHQCSKYFIAEINFDLNGDYVIECPYCSHEHCRTVKDGKITEARWDGRNQRKTDEKRSVWIAGIVTQKDTNIIAAGKTSTVSNFIRDAWLNRSDFSGA